MSHILHPPFPRRPLARLAVRNGERVAGEVSPPGCGGRVSQAGEGPSGGSVDESDVDTIEMELPPEDLARLMQISADNAAAGGLPPPAPPLPSAPGPSARASNDGIQSIQAELAAGLAPPPTDLPAAGPPPVLPASDALAPPAKNAPLSVTREAQISKPVAAPPISRAVSQAQIVPISLARATPASQTQAATVSAQPATPSPASVARVADKAPTPAASREVRGARWLAALIGVFAVVAASVWLWSLASFQADDPPPPAPTTIVEPEPVSTPATTPAPEPSATTLGEVVKFRNPFDAAEVFEFPVGTSRTDARQAVAQFLLQRACERRVPTAKNFGESPCGQATLPADFLRTSAKDSP
jgi:hypothetical protein